MKKLISIITFFLFTYCSYACDICGCSAGNYFIGPFPQFHKHFFGIRYSFRSFHSQMASDATQFSKDLYQTAEVWGGWNINKKWQLLAFVPYSINQQNSDDGLKRTQGLGDITLIANYNILNKKTFDKHNNNIAQQLWIGGGLKLPTGTFSVDPDEVITTANNQPGTGSVDILVNTIYNLNINKWGMTCNASYKINNSADSFYFGNKFSSSVLFYRNIGASAAISFSPNIGFLYENTNANKYQGVKVAETGGYTLLGTMGVETTVNKIVIGFNTQLPLAQNMSNGQTITKLRGMFHVSLAF